ncbi:MAG: polyprenol monophosphomannose synthase [Actinomycetota bacterium]
MTEGIRGLVVVPTYNEAGSIRDVVDRLFEAAGGSVHLLVVDDGSPDGTAEIVEELAQRRPEEIHLLRRASKAGLGTAYVEGFRWGLERGYGAMVEMDADLSHDPAVVPALLDALDEADLVIGSRYVPGGKVENWGAFRRALSRFGNIYARVLLGYEVKDSTAGFRAYRRSWLATEDLSTVASHGYAFQIEMTRRVHSRGGRIAEVPITFVERTTGNSKMSRRIVAEALVEVTMWGLRDRVARRRLHK